MSGKKQSAEEKDINEKLKYEIAEELGLLNKVSAEGWKSLTAKESGKIGGLLTKRKREDYTV
jgi:hypothetical protein